MRPAPLAAPLGPSRSKGDRSDTAGELADARKNVEGLQGSSEAQDDIDQHHRADIYNFYDPNFFCPLLQVHAHSRVELSEKINCVVDAVTAVPEFETFDYIINSKSGTVPSSSIRDADIRKRPLSGVPPRSAFVEVILPSCCATLVPGARRVVELGRGKEKGEVRRKNGIQTTMLHRLLTAQTHPTVANGPHLRLLQLEGTGTNFQICSLRLVNAS
ncbi:hypothetical protein DFH09DRAFT_1097857 [Mycena vulgaris]|nr:hypothetical protein DFH09DRAFT_1113567 [Mycena vulgaris]KAJ6521255.1 hypothetical protein DFH09DRAFT_1097857 [Mycena vulgaris]